MFYQNNLQLKIIDVFLVERSSKEAFDFHRDFTAISYRISGSSIFETKYEKKMACDNSIVYIPEKVDFHRITQKNEKLIIVHLEVDNDVQKNIEVIPNVECVDFYFKNLYETWISGKDGAYNKCMSILYEIFWKLSEPTTTDKSSIQKGVELLKRSFRNPNISIADLAKEAAVSEVYFRRIFKKEYKISPYEALLEMRFNYAKDLLSSGYYTITQTALMSGFGDVKYFRTAFKRKFGITPTDYSRQK